MDCPARSQVQRQWHFKARLTAVAWAKLAAQSQTCAQSVPVAMARVTRRAFNQPLLDRMMAHWAEGGSLDKSSLISEMLCHYGTSADVAA
jgi:hypothetical protein